MDTLGKQITAKFFAEEEDYERLRAFWSTEMKARVRHASEVHFLYKMLIGKDWRTGYCSHKRGCHDRDKIARRARMLDAGVPAVTPFDIFVEYMGAEAPKLIEELLDVKQVGQAYNDEMS